MIKINNKDYTKYDTKIIWGDFNVCSNGEKRTGIAPFIQFNIEDKIFIGLEFVYPKEMWEDTKNCIKIDMKQYLTDITYEDEKGWISLIVEEHNCYITKIEENIFKIDLFVESVLENIKIELNVKVQF